MHMKHKTNQSMAGSRTYRGTMGWTITPGQLHMQYAKELCLPIKCLHQPWPVYNVDGTRNKNGDIKHYTDLEMQMGDQRV